MDIVDILIYIHPDLLADQRVKLEETIGSSEGIVSVHFSPQHTRELTIAYNPETTSSKTILEQVRLWDREATMVGL